MKVRSLKFLGKWQLLLLLLPTILYFLIFHYGPMYGIQLAFKEYVAVKGIEGSPWAEPVLKHFIRFFNSYNSISIIQNTLILSFYQCAVGFALPILLALMLNQVRGRKFKRLVQTVTYAPHFLSIVVMVGMILIFLSPSVGVINQVIKMFGGQAVPFMNEAGYFRHIYVWTGAWQSTGWGAIIYLSVLASVDPSLHEAAITDGANRLQRTIHIDVPSLMPTAVLLLIMSAGNVMNIGFEKAFLMQNALNMKVSEIIPTYVYKIGLLDAQYSFSTAVGLFNSAVNMVLLFSINFVAGKLSENSLF